MRTSRMWPLSQEWCCDGLASRNEFFVSDIAIVGNTPLTDLTGANVHVITADQGHTGAPAQSGAPPTKFSGGGLRFPAVLLETARLHERTSPAQAKTGWEWTRT